jgi:hypothetical protein
MSFSFPNFPSAFQWSGGSVALKISFPLFHRPDFFKEDDRAIQVDQTHFCVSSTS